MFNTIWKLNGENYMKTKIKIKKKIIKNYEKKIKMKINIKNLYRI